MHTRVIKIDPQNPEAQKISHCAEIIRKGGLVAFPTETVYGLAANLLDKKAISRLYRVKKRSEGKPFSLHIAEKEIVEDFAMNLTPTAYKLIDKFWPGPLTLILPSREGGSIGIRMPNNPIALRLLSEAKVPVVAPSANLSGKTPSKSLEEVLTNLNGLIEVVIDGGPTELGLESTIVDLTTSPPEILRKGAIDETEIQKVMKTKTILFVCTGNSCRSVMAEGLLKKMLGERTDVEVLSAGTGVLPDMAPTKETMELLKREGIDISGHTATSLTDDMIKKADLILVMEKLHEEKILGRVPSARNRLYILKEFAKMTDSPGADLGIYDPIGKPMWSYGECFAVIKEAVKRVAELI